MLVIAESNVV